MERLRRLKMKPEMREMLQETVLRSESLIAPLVCYPWHGH